MLEGSSKSPSHSVLYLSNNLWQSQVRMWMFRGKNNMEDSGLCSRSCVAAAGPCVPMADLEMGKKLLQVQP